MMEFEKKYHEEYEKMIQEVDEELQKEQASMTEDERLAEKKRKGREFKRLVERIEEDQERTRLVVDQEKMAHFEKMAEAAKALAEKTDADISISSGEKRGLICLSTDIVMFGEPNRYSGREELVLLMRMADDAIVMPEGDTVRWEFRFEFCDKFVS